MLGDLTAERALVHTLERAERAGWKGADPYDGLLSTIGAAAIPLGSLARMALLQTVTRSGLVRRVVNPTRSTNPKGLGLFLGSVLRGRDTLGPRRARDLGVALLSEIELAARKAPHGIGWGYPFPWQSRFFYAPAGTSNAVVTATVGWHLLDWADEMASDRARSLGFGAAQFLSQSLVHQEAPSSGASVSYIESSRDRIVNVSMLAARLLMRVGADAPRRPSQAVTAAEAALMRAQADRLLQFGLSQQLPSGFWKYAVEARGNWVDSYHMGFILESLLSLRTLGAPVPNAPLLRGLSAYASFFDPDGGARYSSGSRSFYDAHSAAQGIVTYTSLASDDGMPSAAREDAAERAGRIVDWSLRNLWISPKGYFAYRVIRGRRDERDYSRWVQAWMALALGTALGKPSQAEVVEAQEAR